MAVSQKVISGNDQPSGGGGIVSIAGARGLAAADKIGTNNSVSPFPPLEPSQLDMSIASIDSLLDGRYSIVQAYQPNSPSGVAVTP